MESIVHRHKKNVKYAQLVTVVTYLTHHRSSVLPEVILPRVSWLVWCVLVALIV